MASLPRGGSLLRGLAPGVGQGPLVVPAEPALSCPAEQRLGPVSPLRLTRSPSEEKRLPAPTLESDSGSCCQSVSYPAPWPINCIESLPPSGSLQAELLCCGSSWLRGRGGIHTAVDGHGWSICLSVCVPVQKKAGRTLSLALCPGAEQGPPSALSRVSSSCPSRSVTCARLRLPVPCASARAPLNPSPSACPG